MILNDFRKKFYERHDGAALVLSYNNRYYLTHLPSSAGAVLVTPGASYLIVDFRYYEMAKLKVEGYEIVLLEGALYATVKGLLEKEDIKKVYIEEEHITVAQHRTICEQLEGCETADLGDIITKMREVKTEEEIKRINEAQKLADAAFSHILDYLHAGLTDTDVAVELDFFMRKNGARSSAFDTIAVSGTRSALPHGRPEGLLLTPDSFLTMDFGARLDGYCSDMTRTVVIGRADEEMKKVYDTVLKAQLAALDTIRAGVTGDVVDAAARDIIYGAGYEGCFGHSTGHGIGIGVHESPSYSPNYKHTIPKGAVLSIEPGIYIEGKYGVRIEDLAVVGEDGPINLTKSDKKLIEIR